MIGSEFMLFVGLGNPGAKYNQSRHNVGFMALERFAQKEFINFRQTKKLYGLVADFGSGIRTSKLLMPTTYMNESGRSIRAAVDWFEISIDQILVIVDDMDLPLGKLRLRKKGSSGGHNGLKSIIQHLGTDNFCRLKIGIGAPSQILQERKEKTISHVLGTFSEKEIPIVDKVLDEVINGLDLIQQVGVDQASNKLNSYLCQ